MKNSNSGERELESEFRIVSRAGMNSKNELEGNVNCVSSRQHEFEEGKFELVSCAGMIDENVLDLEGHGKCVSCWKRCAGIWRETRIVSTAGAGALASRIIRFGGKLSFRAITGALP